MALPYKDDGSVNAAIRTAVVITKSDTVDLPDGIARGFYAGGAGNVVVIPVTGAAYTMTAVAPGVWHPIMFKRINSTSTTATSMLAGY